MKLDRLLITDVLRFRGAFELDFRTLDPGVVAITGPNGHGKTSLIEIPAGAVYRLLPSRRRDGVDPVQYATSREAALGMDWTTEDGRQYRSMVNLDGQTRKSDAVLSMRIGEKWSPITDGKLTTYRTAMAELFPSYELFNASAFAAQGKGARFVDTPQSERQELFAECLGLQRMALMAKTASTAKGAAAATRDRVLALIAGLADATSDAILADCTTREADLAGRSTTAHTHQADLRVTLDRLNAELLTADDGAAAATALAKRSKLAKDLSDANLTFTVAVDAIATEQARGTTEVSQLERSRTTQLQDIDTRVAGNQQILDQADAIRAAVAAIGTSEAELTTARASLTEASRTRHEVFQILAEAEKALTAFTQPKADLARAKADSALLATVPCGGAGEFSACQFLVNAAAAQARIAALEQTVSGMTAAIVTRDEARQRLDRATTDVTEIEMRITALEAVRVQHQDAAKYSEPLAAAEARIDELKTKRGEIEAQTTRLITEARARQTTRLAELTQEKAAFEATVSRLAGELRTAEAEHAEASTRYDRTARLQQDITEAQRQWDGTVGALAAVEAGLADVTRRRREHAAAVSKARDLEARLMVINAELLEWETLAKAFGRNGLPDLEIDAAGPTISATANEILAVCYGARFTLELVTQTEKADGGMKSEFTVRVWDNDAANGEWHDIGDLSGGEKVIVSEALMNAISLYVNQRAEHPIRTLWRDETGSALDPANAVRYVEMLRKVRELGGIHHVFFISHNAEAAALADAQIQVKDGSARLVLPPFAQAAA